MTYIAPGEPTEFLSLSEWMRDASAFNICGAMRFFKYFLPRKMFQVWRSNVRFNRYCKQRYNVRNRLFPWKLAFTGAIQEIQGSLSNMERTLVLETSGARYSLQSFTDAQTTARTDAIRVFERQITSMQQTIERVIQDVVKRAHAKDDDEEDEDGEGGGHAASKAKEMKNKSMAAAKAEAQRKAAALRAAQAEESVLGSFVRLVDYMVVETLARVVTASFSQFKRELDEPEHRKGALPGMFTSAVRFEIPLGKSECITTFEPACDDLLAMLDAVVADTIKACTGVPRILYARPFREYVQDLPTALEPGNLGAPSVAALLAESPVFRSIRRGIEDKFEADFKEAATYVAVFDTVRPIFDYKSNFDFAAYKVKEQTTYSLQRDMSRLKAWDTQIERMRSQHVEGALFIDSKRLKSELEPITVAGMDRLKGLLLELAKTKCKSVSDTYMSRAKVLDMRQSTLEKFAAHMERLIGVREAEAPLLKEASAVEDMYKLLASYEVKITSEESVALDDMRNAGMIYTDSFRKSEQWLEEKLPEMSRQL